MTTLSVKSVAKQFGNLVALDGVSIEVSEKQMYGLIGPNGSGKTTLLNVISGVLKPDGGDIFLAGVSIKGKTSHNIARLGLARTFQTPRVFQHLSVLENLTVVQHEGGDAHEARELLSEFGLKSEMDKPAENLGYGEKKQLDLARALILKPSIIMLDEPMAGLDFPMIKTMSGYIEKLCRSYGKTVIIVEHHLEELMSLSDHIFVFDHGKKIEEGPPETIRDSKAVHLAYFGR